MKPKKIKTTWLERLRRRYQWMPTSEDALVDLIKACASQHIITPESSQMMQGVLSMGNKQVRDIMIPRSHIVSLSHRQTLHDVLPTLLECKHSRFPVINQSIDDIHGILLAKDLLFHLDKPDQTIDLWCLPAHIVPESKRIDDLLRFFQKHHQHMVMVVDEYGSTSGLITLEDIVEEIVGEIEDEYYQDTGKLIQKVGEKQYIILGHTPLDELNKTLDLQLEHEHVDTLSGYICHTMSMIPKPGDQLTDKKMRFTIQQMKHRTIHSLRLDLLS